MLQVSGAEGMRESVQYLHTPSMHAAAHCCSPAGARHLSGRLGHAELASAGPPGCSGLIVGRFFARHLHWACSILQLIAAALAVPGTCQAGMCMLTGRAQRHQPVQRCQSQEGPLEGLSMDNGMLQVGPEALLVTPKSTCTMHRWFRKSSWLCGVALAPLCMLTGRVREHTTLQQHKAEGRAETPVIERCHAAED